MKDERLHGLYAVTDGRDTDIKDLLHRVEQALLGGARLIQYRDKRSRERERFLEEALGLRELCRSHHALLIINDDVELAARSRAHGVHLGKDDSAYEHARERLGPGAVIGVSCYNDLRRGLRFADLGADYIAYGRFFASRNKPGAVQAGPALLRQTRRQRDHIPIAAIGGITPDNGGELIRAGATMLAAIHGVFAQPDIASTCRRFSSCFHAHHQ